MKNNKIKLKIRREIKYTHEKKDAINIHLKKENNNNKQTTKRMLSFIT